MLRVLCAAVFVFVAMMWSSGVIPKALMPWAMFVVIPLAVFISFALFDRHFLRRLLVSDEKHIDKQIEKGRAAKQTLTISRALSFEDLRTSCMVHFLELDGGSVMVLYGQYLYEYEPIDDDPEMNQPRRFPTSTITIVRYVKSGELLDLEIGSEVIDTKLIQEPDDYSVIADLGFKLEDGEVVDGVTFDELETALTNSQSAR